MPSAVKNEKGLFASPSSSASFDAKDFETAAELCRGLPGADDWLNALKAECSLRQTHFKQASYPMHHAYSIGSIPGGFANETSLWPESTAELRERWQRLAALRSRFSPTFKDAPAACSSSLAAIDAALPRKAALERFLALNSVDLHDGWEAHGARAWAIWMGSDRELGYMDDRKRPSGIAAARLFESQAAAERTAKSAKFGSDRGPAAIVSLLVECVAIESSEPGAPCSAPRAEMARRESQELRDYLEEATLDDIRRALGLSSLPGEREAEAEPHPPAGSLAGREEGFACWVDADPARGRPSGGFVNIRDAMGPISGAVLQRTPAAARNKTPYWSGSCSVVKVACRPEAICSRLGEPHVEALSLAISWEASQSQAAALARQSSEALRERAIALAEGSAAPRRKSRSL